MSARPVSATDVVASTRGELGSVGAWLGVVWALGLGVGLIGADPVWWLIWVMQLGVWVSMIPPVASRLPAVWSQVTALIVSLALAAVALPAASRFTDPLIHSDAVRWMTMVTVVGGLWLVLPAARLLAGTGGAVVAIGLLLVGADTRAALSEAVFVTVAGVAVSSGAAALIEAAHQFADASTQRDRAEQARHLAQTPVDAAARLHRLLHDHVLPVLRGCVDGDPAGSLRTQARAAVTALAAPTGASLQVDDLISAVSDTARISGLRVKVRRTGAPDGAGTRLPTPVVDAIIAATCEAVRNVARHAGVSECVVWVHDDTPRGLAVRVSDVGVGFTGEGSGGGGLDGTIRAGCAQVGVDVGVHSAPGLGTEIRLAWTNQPAVSLAPADLLVPLARKLSIALLVAVFAYLVAAPTTVGLIAFGLLVALVGVSQKTDDWLSTPALALAGLTAFAAGWLPGVGLDGCDRVGAGWWAPVGGAVCVVVVALMARSVWVTVPIWLAFTAGYVTLVLTDGGCWGARVAASLAVDVAVCGGVMLLRVRLQRLTEKARQRHIAALRLGEETGWRARVAYTHLLGEQMLAAQLRPILADIEAGCDDAALRLRATRLICAVQAVRQIPAGLDQVCDGRLTRIVLGAAQRGVLVRLSGDGNCGDDPVAAADCVRLLEAATNVCAAGDQVGVYLDGPRPDLNLCTIRLITPGEWPLPNLDRLRPNQPLGTTRNWVLMARWEAGANTPNLG